MGFLRRLFGGGSDAGPPAVTPLEPSELADDEAAERQRDLEVLREEQERFDDLAQRQLRYADYAWKPPAQGGERRADDADEPRG
jgi:hypothetical protein